ncbi:MAG: AAA family ATPase [Defluviitaleaceae bacterium]|nr:AAA family ATPase [Defluviitaleaceae bacterium]
MKYVWIFGPPAVGKMTVGQELERITGLKLFHNHMVMDLVSYFSDAMKAGASGRITKLFIEEILAAVAEGGSHGLIYTSVSRFDNTSSWEYSMKLVDIFASRGAEVCFVELEADLDERVERNKTPNRLANKPSKRDVALSEKGLRDSYANERTNSREGEISHGNYIRINNTRVPPDEVARVIKDKFAL